MHNFKMHGIQTESKVTLNWVNFQELLFTFPLNDYPL